MRRGPRWSLSEGGPLAHAAGAPVIPKRKKPPLPCSGGLGGPKVEEPPSPIRRGPRWSESEGGPLTNAAGAPVVPKRERPPRPCSGGPLNPDSHGAGPLNLPRGESLEFAVELGPRRHVGLGPLRRRGAGPLNSPWRWAPEVTVGLGP